MSLVISSDDKGMIVKPYTQKVALSIPVWGSEIVFLSIGLDDHTSIILNHNYCKRINTM